jgi:hypothetical protein
MGKYTLIVWGRFSKSKKREEKDTVNESTARGPPGACAVETRQTGPRWCRDCRPGPWAKTLTRLLKHGVFPRIYVVS